MNILLQGHIAVSGESCLREIAESHWQINTWTPESASVDEFNQLATAANVIIGGNIPSDVWPSVPDLALFQIPWAGYNHTGPERIPAGVPVCNCFEHESSIAEYVLLAILEWEIRLSEMDRSMRDNGWAGRITGMSGSFHGEVAGKTLGLIGYGHIAQAVAVRAKAFDMKIKAVRRNTANKSPELDWLGNTSQLHELLGSCDYVVIACDLNPATKNLLNKDTFAQMKPTGVLINVSRGGIVDEEALYDALESKKIGGAVIDTWYNYNQKDKPEVSPFNKPFDKLDNLIMSAHECGWTKNQVRRRWQFIAGNIANIEKGQQPENIVFTGTA